MKRCSTTQPGCQVVALRTIAKIDRISVQPQHIEAGTLYVGLEHIDGDGHFNNVKPVTKGELASSKFRFTPSHILFGKLRPYLRKTARPDFGGICSTDILPILPCPAIDRNYLFHYLRQSKIVDLATSRSSGANLPRLSPTLLAEFPISLPPYEEQKRIAQILDKADALRDLRTEGLQRLEQLLCATFAKAFGDPIANPYAWERVSFDEILEAIESGWSPVCLDRPAGSDEWGVLKLGAITQCVFVESENKALPETQMPRSILEVAAGDLLFSRKNTKDLVAACALVETTRDKLMMPDLIFRLRLKDEARCLPEYLWALLTNDSKRKQVQQLAAGTSGSMPNISKDKLRRLLIELPPLEKQLEFRTHFRTIRRLQKRMLSSLRAAEAFSDSIQSKLFSGELSQRELEIHV